MLRRRRHSSLSSGDEGVASPPTRPSRIFQGTYCGGGPDPTRERQFHRFIFGIMDKTLGVLPVDFYVGQNHQRTYEFYYPATAARQFGFGQLSIHAFFANLVQPRHTINSGSEYGRLKNLAPSAETIILENWIMASFTTKTFLLWLSKWCSHLFCILARIYCQMIYPSFVVPIDEVQQHPLSLFFFPFLSILNKPTYFPRM